MKISRVEIKANRIKFLIRYYQDAMTVARKQRLNKLTNQLMLQFLKSYPVKMHLDINEIDLKLPMNKSGGNLTGRAFSKEHRESLKDIFKDTKQMHKLVKILELLDCLNQVNV